MKEKSWHINDLKCVLEMAEQKVAWIIQIRHHFFFSCKRLKHEKQGREASGKTGLYIVLSTDRLAFGELTQVQATQDTI